MQLGENYFGFFSNIEKTENFSGESRFSSIFFDIMSLPPAQRGIPIKFVTRLDFLLSNKSLVKLAYDKDKKVYTQQHPLQAQIHVSHLLYPTWERLSISMDRLGEQLTTMHELAKGHDDLENFFSNMSCNGCIEANMAMLNKYALYYTLPECEWDLHRHMAKTMKEINPSNLITFDTLHYQICSKIEGKSSANGTITQLMIADYLQNFLGYDRTTPEKKRSREHSLNQSNAATPKKPRYASPKL